jgi:hypothetical protein
VQDYADFGLDRLGRKAPEKYEVIPRNEWTPQQREEHLEYNIWPERRVTDPNAAIVPETNIWGNSADLSAGQRNHFNDESYVGHTRNFKEKGVRHVVEIQSDLLQGYKGPGNPKYAELDTSTLKTLHDEYNADLDTVLQNIDVLRNREANGLVTSRDEVARYRNLQDTRIRLSNYIEEMAKEISVRDNPVQANTIKSLQKNWYVRLIREELADAARKGEKTVRFASADTMAKVEGWEDSHVFLNSQIARYQKALGEAQNSKAYWEDTNNHTPGTNPKEYLAMANSDIKTYQRAIDEKLRELRESPRYDKQVQGIYDLWWMKQVTLGLRFLWRSIVNVPLCLDNVGVF